MALISNNIKTGFLIQKHSKWTFVIYFCKINKKLWLVILACKQFVGSFNAGAMRINPDIFHHIC